MGRRRIAIEKIDDNHKRNITFCKRRKGIFKKASELCKLSGCQIAILINSSAGNAYPFLDGDLSKLSSHQLLSFLKNIDGLKANILKEVATRGEGGASQSQKQYSTGVPVHDDDDQSTQIVGENVQVLPLLTTDTIDDSTHLTIPSPQEHEHDMTDDAWGSELEQMLEEEGGDFTPMVMDWGFSEDEGFGFGYHIGGIDQQQQQHQQEEVEQHFSFDDDEIGAILNSYNHDHPSQVMASLFSTS